MTDTYEDIISLPHHVSQKRPRMPVADRAAQFSPFAALTGFDAAISETARLTDEKLELDEYLKAELNDKLLKISNKLGECPQVAITYFKPDMKKSGGAYAAHRGYVKKIAEDERTIVMTDGAKILIDAIIDVELL